MHGTEQDLLALLLKQKRDNFFTCANVYLLAINCENEGHPKSSGAY